MSIEFQVPNVSTISGNKFVKIRLRASRLAACEKTDQCGQHIDYNCSSFGILFLGGGRGEYVRIRKFEGQMFSHQNP